MRLPHPHQNTFGIMVEQYLLSRSHNGVAAMKTAPLPVPMEEGARCRASIGMGEIEIIHTQKSSSAGSQQHCRQNSRGRDLAA